VGFERAIPTSEHLQTHVLACEATGIGCRWHYGFSILQRRWAYCRKPGAVGECKILSEKHIIRRVCPLVVDLLTIPNLQKTLIFKIALNFCRTLTPTTNVGRYRTRHSHTAVKPFNVILAEKRKQTREPKLMIFWGRFRSVPRPSGKPSSLADEPQDRLSFSGKARPSPTDGGIESDS
jgi:hypothetical protein